MNVKRLVELPKEEFLNKLFSLVHFEEWEKDVLKNEIDSYEVEDEFLKLYNSTGEEIVVICCESETYELLETDWPGDNNGNAR